MIGIPTKITTHVASAAKRLLSQFQGKARIEGAVFAFVQQKQLLEDVLWDLYTKRQIDAAEGVQLDRIGAIVGRPRKGHDDATYRKQLWGQVGINTSKGTSEQVIGIFTFLTSATVVTLTPYYPAHVLLQANIDLSGQLLEEILTICQQIVPAGVKVIGIGWYEPSPAEGVFSFAGFPEGQGFGDVNDGEVGGGFSTLEIWA